VRIRLIFSINGSDWTLEEDFGSETNPEIIQIILNDVCDGVIDDACEQGFDARLKKVIRILDT